MRSSRSTCQNTRMKPWLILPFIHLSSSDLTANAAAFGSRKQMELCPSSDQKKKGSSGLICLRQLLPPLFPGQPPKGGRGQGASLLRKPFLKELGSTEQSSWPSQRSGSQIRTKRKKRNGRTLTSLPVPFRPVITEQVSYTRGFGAALSTAKQWMRRGFRVALAGWCCCSSDAPIPVLAGCPAGHISQLSLRIHQRCRACIAHEPTPIKRRSAACCSLWRMPGSGLDVPEKLNSTPVTMQQAVWNQPA